MLLTQLFVFIWLKRYVPSSLLLGVAASCGLKHHKCSLKSHLREHF
jgi:hypothetical protein